MAQRTVEINVVDRKLKVACPVGQESALLSAAEELTMRFNKATSGKSIATPEQAMLMTALNLTNELLMLKKKIKAEQQEHRRKIALLQSTFEQAMSPASKNQA